MQKPFNEYAKYLDLPADTVASNKNSKPKRQFKNKVELQEFHTAKWPLLIDTPIFGFDTEYQLNAKGDGNDILCYTYSISLHDKRHYGYISVDSTDIKRRLKFDAFVVTAIESAIKSDVLKTYPEHLFMVAHFLKADILSFNNAFKGIAAYVSGVRKTLASVSKVYGIDFDKFSRTRIDKDVLKVTTKSKHPKYINIIFYDSMPLAPAGKSLADVGELIGVPKLSIPAPYSIEKMSEYKAGDIEGFKKYAIQDAIIAEMYLGKMIAFSVSQAISKLPITIGAISIKLFFKATPLSVDFNERFGCKVKSLELWDTENSKVRTIVKKCPQPTRLIYEQLAISSYHGGRNEAFWLGLTPEGDYNDFDIPSCYTASMIGLREIDFDASFETTDAKLLCGDICSFAYVSFRFPSNTPYPCLPVRMSTGLAFPLSGESFCTGHEIEVALSLNVEILSLKGFVFPWKNDDRIFEPFVSLVRERRNSHKKKTFEELLWKEIGNSLYGKLAQGLKGKTAFEVESGLSKALPYTGITSPFFAAYTTGIARAVLSEMLASIKPQYKIISVTTDGFLTNSPLSEIPLDGPLCERFRSLYHRVDSGPILEQKHGAKQLICMKTRGQITVKPMQGKEIVLAKAGVRPPRDCTDHNQYMIDKYINRTPTDKTDASHLTPTRDLYLERRDMIMEKKEQRLNIEFDYKRQPVNPKMYSADDFEHVGMSTVPFNHVDDIEFSRAVFKGFRDNHCLKHISDVELFDDFYAMRQATKLHKIRIQVGERSDELLIRLFLRAYAKSLLGLDATCMTGKVLSEWFNSNGYKVSPEKVRGAKKPKLIEGAVPRTKRSMECYQLLCEKFPNADFSSLLEPTTPA